MSTAKKRITWIDTAKGIGVVLVVFGHLLGDSNLQKIYKLIYSFHVPLFFITAGFVSNNSTTKSSEGRGLFKKRFYRVLLPAIIFLVITLPVDILRSTPFDDIIFLNGKLGFNDACWFFIVLFEVEVFYKLLMKQEKRLKNKVLMLIISLFMGYFVYVNDIMIPFGLDRAILGYAFYMIGSLLRDIKDSKFVKKIDNNYCRVLLFILSFTLWLFTGMILNIKVSMYNLILGNYWCFVLSGLFGTIVCYFIAMFFDRHTSIFKEISYNSVLIVCSHYFLKYYFSVFMKYFNLNFTYRYDLFAIIFVVVVISMYQKISKVVDKKIPVLNGKYKE